MDLEKEKSGTIQIDCFEKDICFTGVSFSYGNGKVINDVSFRIQKGSIVGISGSSGSGKSTLAGLLQKLYTPLEGRIFIDDTDLNHIDNDALRKLIGVIPQHTDIFSGSIEENIALGLTDPDWNKISDLMQRLDIDRYDSNLSGGQKQKISIARTMYLEPKILIMDEPTSSLDALSEMKVLQEVELYRKRGNTIIIITHRPAALEVCDKVIYLENGRIR